MDSIARHACTQGLNGLQVQLVIEGEPPFTASWHR